MKLKPLLLLLASIVLWSIFSTEYMINYFVPIYGQLLGNIAANLVSAVGGWIMWIILIKGKFFGK